MGRAVLRASLLTALAGCQAAPPPQPAPRPVAARPVARPPQPPPPPPPPAPPPAAAAEPAAPDDPLTLAADCLERGDLTAAARHLEVHVREFPDQVVFRAQLAELLCRLDRLPEAQAHFEAA